MKKESILIIDDSKLDLMAITHILESDYTVYFEDDAKRGIDSAKSLQPDIILLDVVMPNMTGFDVIEILKDTTETEDIPVIFLTSRGEVQDIELGFMLGAADYIAKPFSAPVVKLRVDSLLKSIRQANEIRELSIDDQLTGIYNRDYFADLLLQEWQRSAAHGHPISLLVLDIDNFRLFNNNYGYPAGDEALRVIAGTLKERAYRAADFVGRWGGEEFIMLLSATNLTGAVVVAEDICREIEATIFNVDKDLWVKTTVSIGVHSVTAKEHDDYTLENFIADTDAALYEAKKRGRNRIVAVGG